MCGREDRQQKIGDRDGWSSGMNEEWFSQTNVCKPNFTVHHYFTFNPRTVNRRSCYNLVLKLSRDLARDVMAKPSDRLSNLRNPWVEVLVFWSSMRAPSIKPPWWHTAGCWTLTLQSRHNGQQMAADPSSAFNPVTQASHQPPCSGFSAPLVVLTLMSNNIQWWCLLSVLSKTQAINHWNWCACRKRSLMAGLYTDLWKQKHLCRHPH